jgi:hypothetical protein
MVFDRNLYRQNRSYQTPRMMPALALNSLVMNKKKVPFLNEKWGDSSITPSSGAEGVRTLVQLCDKLHLLHAYFPINCRDLAGWKPT